MLSDILDWFKGLFGDAAGDAVQSVSDTVQGAGAGAQDLTGGAAESMQTFQEDAVGGATQSFEEGAQGLQEGAQGVQEEAVAGVTDSAQGIQDQLGGAEEAFQTAQEDALAGTAEATQGLQEGAETVSGVAEDPTGAATDYATDAAHDRLTGGA